MSPDRVLFLHDSLAMPGGGERTLMRVAAVARRQSRVDLALVWKRPRVEEHREPGEFDAVIELDSPFGIGLRSSGAHAAALRRLHRALHDRRPSACIAFSYAAAVRTALVVGPRRMPWAWVCQEDVTGLLPVSRRWRRHLAFQILRWGSPDVVCLNQGAIERFTRLGFAPARVHHIPNGVLTASYGQLPPAEAERQALRSRHAVPRCDLVAVCVAHLNVVKGHALLIQAVQIALQAGTRVALLCVGGVVVDQPSNAERLRDQARAAGVEELVVWAGFQPDVRDWLAMSDVAVLASVHEAGPLCLLEAAAAGLPLLASDTPGTRGAVLPEVTGLPFPPGDAVACAAALIRLAKDRDLRQRLGAGAREHVRRTFDIERMDLGWSQLIRTLLDRKRAS